MIIADLNHIEVLAEETVVGGTYRTIAKRFKFDANIDYKSRFDKKVDIKSRLDSKVDIKGNQATLVFDAQAFGPDTFTEAEVGVYTEAGYTSASFGSLISAADYYYYG